MSGSTSSNCALANSIASEAYRAAASFEHGTHVISLGPQLASELPVIAASHQRVLLEAADRVITLNGGKQLDFGLTELVA